MRDKIINWIDNYGMLTFALYVVIVYLILMDANNQ